jgi:N-glycosidase YbiA
MTIYFYSTVDEYGFMSNFSRYGFELDGQYWPTSEHYFQAQKFVGVDADYVEKIRTARRPKQAANLGRSRKIKLRADWEEIKDEVMYRAVLKKFQTHEDIRERLSATGDKALVENAPGDYYWGCGTDGSGKNRLGELLMRVRADLRPTDA